MRLLFNKDYQLLITEISENEINNLNNNVIFYTLSLIFHSFETALGNFEQILEISYFF